MCGNHFTALIAGCLLALVLGCHIWMMLVLSTCNSFTILSMHVAHVVMRLAILMCMVSVAVAVRVADNVHLSNFGQKLNSVC